MSSRERPLVFPRPSTIAWLLGIVLFWGSAYAQESIATQSGVAERAFPYKALPIELWVERGDERLPISKVPELAVGDLIRLSVNLDAPELTSLNSAERQRLRDWSIGWFLTTPEGSLVFDSTRSGRTDRGRIDLARGERELTIKVEHERQKFPILFFVRTRTLESWEEIRRTRQTKASNFVDHFGRYSDVVGDYENLQAFLRSLQREEPQAESLEERLSAGFGELGFTVDTKMHLDDPSTIAKLLGELESSLNSQSQTFQAEAAGKMLSQMIGDHQLGLIGAAASIGGFLYRATDYSESYHWSSARLQDNGGGRYTVMSSERVRHGEAELAPDGASRSNVRSILVCTPMARQPGQPPRLGWTSDAANSLLPSSTGEPPEVLVSADTLASKTHPSLVQPVILTEAEVWDAVHGEASPLSAHVSDSGTVTVSGWDKLWARGEVSVEVRLTGRWGFERFELARFTALRSTDGAVRLKNAPYLLSRGQQYRLELERVTPVAIGKVRFAGSQVALREDDGKLRLALELAGVPEGPQRLEIYAGEKLEPANLLLSQQFWVVSSSAFHVLLPEGSSRLELVADHQAVFEALSGVSGVKVGAHTFTRQQDSLFFDAPEPPPTSELTGTSAELLFPQHGSLPEVHLEIARRPSGVELALFPPNRSASTRYQVDLAPSDNRLLVRGQAAEFRLRADRPWPAASELQLEVVEPSGRSFEQQFTSRPQAGQSRLRAKGEVLFGEFSPQETGALSFRLRLPIDGSALPLQWSTPTPWRVVDLPEITAISGSDGDFRFEGDALDIVIARVYRSADPGVDPDGSPLERLPEGGYRLLLDGFDPRAFWLELGDLRGEGLRLPVRARNLRR